MFINPYADVDFSKPALRSNFHTHAGTGRYTCGHYPIREVLRNYNRLNYDVICLSNHDRFTNPKHHRGGNILLIPGYEFSRDPHIVCVGTTHTVAKDHQRAISTVAADGGFTILAHPNWQRDYYLPKEMIHSLHGYAGIEILNGSVDFGTMSAVNKDNRGDAADVYDYILSEGLLKWCFGNDDFHRWWHCARCWTMIFADKTERGVIDAVKAGKLYASTGPVLTRFDLIDGVITVSARGGEGYTIPFEFRFVGYQGEVLSVINDTSATYTLRGDEKYVRVEILTPVGHKLYTQPVYDDTFFASKDM